MKQDYGNDQFLQKRKERQKKIRKRRIKVFFILFMLVLLVTGAVLSLTVLFPIKNITAKGSKIYTAEQIIKYSGIEIEDNLFTVSEKHALNNLKKVLPFVENVELERSLPDTLNIKITDAKEYACYGINDKYYTVSKSGWVLAEYTEKPQNVILIICKNVKCKTGTVIELSEESSHNTAQTIIDELLKRKITVDYVDITEITSLKAKVNGRFLVNFGTSVDLEPKIKHLNSMMQEIGEKKTGIINLNMWNSQNTQGTFVQTDIK